MPKAEGRIDREGPGSLAYDIKHQKIEDIDNLLNQFNFKTKLDDHQSRSVILGIANDTFLFAHEMGLGKTKIALDIITARKKVDNIRQTFVSCPLHAIYNWERQVREHSHLSCNVIDGDASTKLDLLIGSKNDVVICPHTWIRRLFSKGLKNPDLGEDLDVVMERFDCAIFDEAHNVRNPQTVGFKGYARFLMNTKYRYLLTGTPCGNDYTGVWSLYYLLDRGATYGNTYQSFEKHFFNVHTVVKNYVPVYNLCTLKKEMREEFFQKFWTLAIRYEEKEALDLPPIRYQPIPIDMTKEQDKAYDKICFGDNVEETDIDPQERGSPDVFRAKLMRITAGIGMSKSPKLEALLEFVNQVCVEEHRQLIVWHWLVDEGRAIEEAIRKKFKKKVKVGAGRGETSDNRKQLLEDWRQGKVQVLVANPASMGEAIDLYEASIAIFFSNAQGLIMRKQAEKRIHRKGQTRNCLIIDLVCKDTVDELTLEKLNEAYRGFAELTKDLVTITDIRNQRKPK